jgi:predicted small integral membrane protein
VIEVESRFGIEEGMKMFITRLSKTAFVASIAFFATLVSFGNITDYSTNYAFVEHVLMMDTIFPDATINYRAITSPLAHHIAYNFIIACETLTALLCWVGAFQMLGHLNSDARAFNKSKSWAIAGLAFGFLVWEVGFMSVGGEWFGMWMSETWNGIESAFRFFITIIAVLIFVAMPEQEQN